MSNPHKASHSREPVESASLASVGYDLSTRTLEVEFRRGGIYRYVGVPATVSQSLMEAPSKGRFFAAEIRNCFPYTYTRSA